MAFRRAGGRRAPAAGDHVPARVRFRDAAAPWIPDVQSCGLARAPTARPGSTSPGVPRVHRMLLDTRCSAMASWLDRSIGRFGSTSPTTVWRQTRHIPTPSRQLTRAATCLGLRRQSRARRWPPAARSSPAGRTCNPLPRHRLAWSGGRILRPPAASISDSAR